MTDPGQTGVNGRQAFVQLHPTRHQRGLPLIGQGATDRGTVTLNDLRFLVLPSAHRPLQWPDAPHPFLQFLLGMPIGFPRRAGGLLEIMVVTSLMRHPREDLGDRLTDTGLPIAHHAHHRGA